MAVALTDEPVAALEGFRGSLLRPGDAAYDVERRVYNGLIDKRPDLIAQCQGVADVAAAIRFARENGLEIGVRGAGHSVSGRGMCDGGVLVDLSKAKGVFVDPAARTVRAQGGVTWGELNRETQMHGLAVTGGVVSTTGIAGLTLGGGLGWLIPKYGMAVDNLASAEVVTADGRVLTASEDEHPDLFWGVRGGGGNFGVVTTFQYRLHPVGPVVTGGLVAHPFEAARDVLRLFRDFTSRDLPDELMAVGALVHAPDGSGMPLAAIAVCHVGGAEEAARDLEPVVAFGTPIVSQIAPLPYEAQNAMLDGAYPPGSLNYWKSSFVRELSDEAIDALVERFEQCPSPVSSVVLEHFHGAVCRVPVDATAFPHRQPGYNLVLTSVWFDPSATEANVEWTRGLYGALTPDLAEGRYVNYLDEDDLRADAARAAYGPAYARLVEVKRAYDPDNVFRQNANVIP
jgi:FAD/FMN-containing dehydrogenase